MSVFSERLLSPAGDLYSDSRKLGIGLAPECADMPLLTRYNFADDKQKLTSLNISVLTVLLCCIFALMCFVLPVTKRSH